MPKLSPTEMTAPRRAFTTDDCSDILRYAAAGFDGGMGCALVTLVEIRGGAARPLGAQMAVREDGTFCGYVSGGCTEAAVAAEAVEAIAQGHDRYLYLGEGSAFFDITLPCGGGIKLSIHVLKDSRPLHAVLKALSERRRIGLRYDPSEGSLAAHPHVDHAGWLKSTFAIGYRPAPRLLLSGGTIEAESTSGIARAAGFEVRLDSGERSNPFDGTAIDADTAVALLHHDLDRELPLLQAALAARPFYIGALGSHRTHQKRCDALRNLGYDDADIARIKAPIGVFGKARDSRSLALSVVADIAAARQPET
jgi:xanthine dehydrogenase accessory factor